MKMFIVDNTKKIQGEKILNIGTERSVTINFQFEDAQFNDEDDFILIVGQAYSFEYAFRNNGFLSFRRVDLSEIITKNSQNFAIKVYQGQDQILDDTITINSEGEIDIDLSDYAKKEDLQQYVKSSDLSSTLSSYVTNDGLSSQLSNYATTSYVSSTLSNYATTSYVSSLIGDINSSLDSINGTSI